MRKVHNDYDSDELDNIDPLSGLKKHEKSDKYDEYIKEQNEIRISRKRVEEEDKKLKKGKGLPPVYKSSTGSYMISGKGKRGDEEEDMKEKRGTTGQYKQSSVNYMSGRDSRSGKDEDYKKERQSSGQSKPATESNYMTNPKRDSKGIYKKEKKGINQFKTTSVNYMISTEEKRQAPKMIDNKRKMQYKSQNKEVSGLMKRKQKESCMLLLTVQSVEHLLMLLKRALDAVITVEL